jgi:hypothetical protein
MITSLGHWDEAKFPCERQGFEKSLGCCAALWLKILLRRKNERNNKRAGGNWRVRIGDLTDLITTKGTAS